MQIIDKLLTNKVPRPGLALDTVQGIVLHYPGVAKQSARDVVDFWQTNKGKVGSAHLVIDLDGTIYRAIPVTEKAYHVGSMDPDPASGLIYTDLARRLFGDYAIDINKSPNRVTIGIEMCHTNAEGAYTPETVAAAVEVCTVLCKTYGLDPLTRIVTHHDVVGWKRCPAWYIDHPEDLDALRAAVAERMAT
jgi:N-acetylmuramoyl-L-alanine amidase